MTPEAYPLLGMVGRFGDWNGKRERGARFQTSSDGLTFSRVGSEGPLGGKNRDRVGSDERDDGKIQNEVDSERRAESGWEAKGQGLWLEKFRTKWKWIRSEDRRS